MGLVVPPQQLSSVEHGQIPALDPLVAYRGRSRGTSAWGRGGRGPAAACCNTLHRRRGTTARLLLLLACRRHAHRRAPARPLATSARICWLSGRNHLDHKSKTTYHDRYTQVLTELGGHIFTPTLASSASRVFPMLISLDSATAALE